MREELVKTGRNFERLDGKFGEPLLKEALRAKMVAVELMSAGPGNEKGGRGEEDKAVGIGERESMFGPADQEGLGKEIA